MTRGPDQRQSLSDLYRLLTVQHHVTRFRRACSCTHHVACTGCNLRWSGIECSERRSHRDSCCVASCVCRTATCVRTHALKQCAPPSPCSAEDSSAFRRGHEVTPCGLEGSRYRIYLAAAAGEVMIIACICTPTSAESLPVSVRCRTFCSRMLCLLSRAQSDRWSPSHSTGVAQQL
jgi:hypothetical protein